MADIHIGTVNARGDVTVYYHVPVAEALRAHTAHAPSVRRADIGRARIDRGGADLGRRGRAA